MRRACLLLTALVALTGCSFEEPPSAGAGVASELAAVGSPPPPVADLCTEIVLTLLDGQLNPLPTADPATFDKAGRVADAFQQRYDAVIASSGIGPAREQYAGEIQAACTG